MQVSLYTAEECEKIATTAALRYVKNTIPGIQRRKCGKGYTYYMPDGKRITDKVTLQRIKALAIPPAYQKVWICPFTNGHIQATGIDDRKRKQYLYHSLWHEARQQQKFNSLIQFGQCLPLIRKHVRRQLDNVLTLDKRQVLCAIIYLLDTVGLRIGNSVYAKENDSYGVTTLRKKHLCIKKDEAILDFPGKSSQTWHIILKNKRLVNLLKKCEEIPGYDLFKYYNEDGTLSVITSQDVNSYLQALTQHSFTAKNFRTWNACRESLYHLSQIDPPLKSNLKTMLHEVAVLLGHTPSICRKSYIDPEIIQWWEEGRLAKWIKRGNNSLADKDKLLLLWLKKRKACSKND